MPLIPGLARYWIEGDLSKVDNWSREGAPYKPGDPIEFRRGGNLGEYVGFGWARREATETAMADPQATVWLRGRFEPSREYLLVIEARPVGDLEPGSPAKVAVSVNEVEVGQVALGAEASFETYRFAVPASVLSRSPDTVIRFSARAPGAAPGREEHDEEDHGAGQEPDEHSGQCVHASRCGLQKGYHGATHKDGGYHLGAGLAGRLPGGSLLAAISSAGRSALRCPSRS